MSRERGQASVECVGLVLLVSLAAAAPAMDGRSFGDFLRRKYPRQPEDE